MAAILIPPALVSFVLQEEYDSSLVMPYLFLLLFDTYRVSQAGSVPSKSNLNKDSYPDGQPEVPMVTSLKTSCFQFPSNSEN